MQKHKGIILSAALVTALAAVRLGAVVDVNSFTIDTTLVLGLYNQVDQSTNLISSLPAEFVDQYKGVIQATVRNTDPDNSVLPTFDLVVTQNGAQVAWTYGGSLTITSPLKPGESRNLTAADFKANSPFNGQLDPAFKNDLQKNFQNVDASKLKDVVGAFIARKYNVCLKSTSHPGQQSCWNVTIFKENPSSRCTVAMLISPHNNGVPNTLPFFLWTPASSDLNCDSSKVSYRLELMDSMDGMPIAQVAIPAGQNFYQWSTNDLALKPGGKYYWRVVGLDCATHSPFCGPNGRGWNIIKWFICGGETTPPCVYNAQEVDSYVKADAATTAEIKKALQGWDVSDIQLSPGADPDLVCKYLRKQVEVKSMNFNLQ